MNETDYLKELPKETIKKILFKHRQVVLYHYV